MGVGQALGIAFGLVFLVLGGLYVLVRTEQAAQRHNENPGGPQWTAWLLAHRLLTVLFVGIELYLGTWFLIHGRPNVFFAAGLATLLYAHALRHAFGLTAALRTILSTYVLAGLLCGIGSALHGGSIGILGAALSLVWSVSWLWLLKMMWRA